MAAAYADAVVEDEADFRYWVGPSVEMDFVAAVLAPFFGGEVVFFEY